MDSLISIIVPTYNRGHYVLELVASLLAQTYAHWECLIIDDGSTDDTKTILLSNYGNEKRIRYLRRNALPKGAPTCRNIGIQHAKGDYLMFLDSDDFLLPFCLNERISKIKQHSNLDFIVFNGTFCDKEKKIRDKIWNLDNDKDDLERFVHSDSVWSITGPLYSKQFIHSNHISFDETLSKHQDVDFALSVLLHQPVYQKYLSTKPDYVVRRHGTASISQESKGDFSIPSYRISIKLLSANTSVRIKEIALNKYFYSLQDLLLNKNFSLFFNEFIRSDIGSKQKLQILIVSISTAIMLKLKIPHRSFLKRMNVKKRILSYRDYKKTIGLYTS